MPFRSTPSIPRRTARRTDQEARGAAEEQRTLLFPVFDLAQSPDGYRVIGWAAFVIDEVVKWNGVDQPGNHVIEGHFVTFIASDLAAGNPITDPETNFGSRSSPHAIGSERKLQ